MREITAEEMAILVRHRKYRHGCLRKVPITWPHWARWRWCIDIGDGRFWFGVTPREAWKNFGVSATYRGPEIA